MKPLLSLPLFAALGLAGGSLLGKWEFAWRSEASSSPAAPSSVRDTATDAVVEPLRGERPSDPVLAAEWDFVRQLESADAAALKRLWEEAGDSPYQAARDEMIVERWARLDPQGAWAVLRASPREAMKAFFGAWFKADPATAVAVAKQKVGHHAGEAWRGLVAAACLEPRRFFELARQEPDGVKGAAYIALTEPAIRGLLAYSQEETLAFAKTLSGHERSRVERVVVESLAAQDLDTALDRVKTATDPKAVSAGLSALLPRLMLEDWMKAGELIRELTFVEDTQDFLQDKLTTGLLFHLQENPQQVVDWIRQNLGKQEFLQWRIPVDLARQVARSSPETALLLRAGESFAAPNTLLNASLPGDPAAILSAAAQAAPGAWRDVVADRALVQWLKTDETAAQAWAAALPEGEFKEQVAFTLAHAEQRDGPRLFERSLAMMTAQPDNETSANVLKEAARLMAGDDSRQAWTRVLELPAGEARSLALEEITTVSARQMPAEETLAWATTVPDAADQAAIFPAVAKILSRDDPPAVSEWLAGLPLGAVRDAAVAVFAEQVRKIEPVAAVAWAASVTEKSRRTQALEKILPDLWESDADLARAALEQAPLSAVERSRWLSQRPDPPTTP